ncbi:MAG: OPT/YSL family transporter, partial [Bacteroidota bacterium]
FLQIIASRGAAQTYFNPIRVMSTLLAGVSATLGASSAHASLSAAGFMAGTNCQATNLSGDMAYGRWYRFPSRWQFWTQASTILVSAFVAALIFDFIRDQFPMIHDSKEGLKAPVAKMWATMALLFDPDMKLNLPQFAIESMWIAGAIGVIYALFEELTKLRSWMPGAVGIGLGMVLSPSAGFGFFLGGLAMFYLLGRFLKVNPLTLNTIAISCVVGEGIGGILTSTLKVAGLIG